jgi:hypothetical protein
MSQRSTGRKTSKQKAVKAAGSVYVVSAAKQKKILAALAKSQQVTRDLQLARRVDMRSLYEQVTL